MKIRTISYFFNIRELNSKQIIQAEKKLVLLKQAFIEKGYEVQTLRLVTQSFTDYYTSNKLNVAEFIESIANNVDFIAIGNAKTHATIKQIPSILSKTKKVSCSANLLNRFDNLDLSNIDIIANVIKEISTISIDGSANFRFAAGAHIKAGTPFFPVAYNDSAGDYFTIGTEASDLIHKAISLRENETDFERAYLDLLNNTYQLLEKIASELATQFKIEYKGIDTSLAPSLKKSESIGLAYKKLGSIFGDTNSTNITSQITRSLKAVNVKKIGYCGLMLPVCEDAGLAELANTGKYGIYDLLYNSGFCGCGIDTVPIAGDCSIAELKELLLNVGKLSVALRKALSIRVFPIPNKKINDLSIFKSPYLTNCKLFSISKSDSNVDMLSFNKLLSK